MARPVKNSCDYFSHDRDMRNHKKIKAIRSKFKATGYAIWVMFLEHLTGSESNVFEYSDLEIELLAGDFDVSVTEIRNVLDYCILIGLLNNENGIINSNSLDERLAPVYEKRNRSKDKSKQQARDNGKFATETNDGAVVTVTETPQSKVKESKVNKSISSKGSLEERKKKFYDSLTQFVEEFSKPTVRSFYEYWTEHNEDGLKMRFEMEKVFNKKKRLVTWKSREGKFETINKPSLNDDPRVMKGSIEKALSNE